MIQLKQIIQQHLQQFTGGALRENALALFETLGYRSEIQMRLEPNTAEHFLEVCDAYNIFDQKRRMRALCAEWKSVDLLFQLTEAEITEQHALFQVNAFNPNEYQSYLFFAIELQGDAYPRSALAAITREINRLFLMPALILFKHGATLTFAIINRRLHKLDSSKDVLEKVTLIKDIRSAAPHRAHIEILHDLSCTELLRKHKVMNFLDLHRAWQATLDIAELNKRFFRELADWYFWAKDYVQFPEDMEPDQEIRNAKNLIRLLTRIMFIWFIKEKSLVPETLFDRRALPGILKNFQRDEQSSTYYQAILQNLFFATLNQQMDKRAFAREGGFEAHKQEYGVKTLLRYADQFAIAKEEALALFAGIPFLNGGLFDCLDKENESGSVVYVDGFSRNPRKRAQVPDMLFFMPQEREVDLSAAYDPSSKKPLLRKVKGLFDLLNSYKFTVAENTPVEEEIALDPELLGKVFENLLASYNPETQTTARKQTGSFYTPREIVNYMVDESLIAYLKQVLLQDTHVDFSARSSRFSEEERPEGRTTNGEEERPKGRTTNLPPEGGTTSEDALRAALSYSERPLPFDERERRLLIAAVNRCKILDPACGSGAFPLGALHKLVHLLHKLDPDNRLWKQEQKERVIGEKIAELKQDQALAERLSDDKVREQAIQAIQDRLQEIEAVFDREHQFDDYARKLYLIENCIYGVDIQPIAVQIAKLRCFISLIIDQKPRPEAENLGLRALPNLETKFVAANTLIGLDKPTGEQMALKNLKIEQLEHELKALRHRYFTAKTRREKLAAQQQDNTLRRQIARLLVNDGWDTSTAQQVVAFDPYDQNASAPFFEPEWMFGMTDGFDIVLGNPPYISIASLPKEMNTLLSKQNYQTYSRSADIYCLFFEKGINLTRNKGILSYISSNRFCFTNYGTGLRKYLSQKNILQLINFNEINVFESANVGSIVSLIQNEKPGDQTILVNEVKGKLSLEAISSAGRKIEQGYYQENQWSFDENTSQRLKQKIESKGIPFIKWKKIFINRGVTTGANKIFVINTEMKEKLCREHPSSNEIIMKVLRGRDIKNFTIQWNGDWLIFTRRGINIDKYPAIKNYLLPFKKELEPGIGRKQGKYKWFEIQDKTAFYTEFEKRKLIWTRLSSVNGFAISEQKEFLLDSTSFAVCDDIEYLSAILNSKVVLFYFKLGSVIWGKDGIKWFGKYFDNIPIPQISKEKQQPFVELVDRILAAKQQNPAADTRALEAEIDRLVYALYGLTEEEIAIVEGKA